MMSRLVVLLLALIARSSSQPRTHTIEIRGMEFHPAVLTVAPGDTVIWFNRDIVPHTATVPSSWDTGQLREGESGRYVPRQPGRVSYICTLHPTMKGTLIIKEQS